MNLYSYKITTIDTEPSIDDWKSLSDGIPKFLLDRAEKFKHWKERAMRLQGWQMLLEELNRLQLGNLLYSINFEDKGKPYLLKNELFFNISNSKNSVILVTAPFRIGVDLEYVRTPKKIIYSRVFCKEEIDYLARSKNEPVDFIRLWTRKEAVVKLFGGGITMGLTKFSVLDDELSAFEETVVIRPIDADEAIVHIAYFKQLSD